MWYYQNYYFNWKRKGSVYINFLIEAKWRSTTWFTTFWNLIFVTFAKFAIWEDERRKVNIQIFVIRNIYANFLQMWYFWLFWLSISTQVFLKPWFLAFNIGPNLAKSLLFFVDFHLNMLGKSINICNFCLNQVVMKKLDKTTKNCFLEPSLH